MKKVCAIVAVLAVFTQMGRAQTSLGAHFGWSGSNIHYVGESKELVSGLNDQNKPLYAPFVGVELKHHFTKRLYVVPTIQLSQRGYEKTAEFNRYKYRATYLNSVLPIGFDLNKYFALELGAYGGLVLDEKIKFPSESNWQSPFARLSDKADGGILAGMAVHLGNITAFGRYNYGLGNLGSAEVTNANGEPTGKLRIKCNFVQIGLGYNIAKLRKGEN